MAGRCQHICILSTLLQGYTLQYTPRTRRVERRDWPRIDRIATAYLSHTRFNPYGLGLLEYLDQKYLLHIP
jgi:hypothetical protein